MGSKKHKKHHKSEKKELSLDDRQEKPLKLVLKVGGSIQSPVHHASNSNSSSSQIPRLPQDIKPVFEESKSVEKSTSHSHEKHKKSKKKKKKKSSDKDKERHERKRKHHHHHHHHREHSHERKEKRRKEQDSTRMLTESHDSMSRDSLSMRVAPELHPSLPIEKPIRDARTCTLKRKAMKSPLQILLYYLMKKLQLKDPQEFFAWPVTDVIAPGYSSIITQPVDFSSINKKIDDREYKSVSDFKIDVKLMCDNAMTYNRSDTVYYKSAKRMWHYAQKLMNREQLACLKRSFPYMLDLSVDELGFNINDESEESMPGTETSVEPGIVLQPEAKKSKAPPVWDTPEIEDDDEEMSPEEILQQAQRAAKAAADRLTLKRPNSKFGFLRQSDNGTTTLSIIHPKAGDKEMKVNLEMLTGKINQGTGTIAGFKEDTKNFIKPVHYNNYGSFASYAPHYDSTFSNLSKEDSDLVLSTYGDELGVQYAESLMNFAKDDYVINMVDSMLDNLTNGEHSKTLKILEEKKKAQKMEEAEARKALKPLNENEMNKSSPQSVPSMSDSECFQTLEDFDLELAQLESSDNENNKNDNEDKIEKRKEILYKRRNIQMKLDNTTQLLHELKKVQNERLSTNPPPHLTLIRQPSALENELAERVTKKLVDVSSQLPPESIVNIKSLRKAMGITYHPINTPSGAKVSKKGPLDSEMERTGAPVPNDSVLDNNSPDVSSDSRIHPQDIETEFRDFLTSGPSLRVCGSPTDS